MERDPRYVKASDLEAVAEAAQRIGVSPSYLYRLIRQNRLDYYKVGQLTLVAKKNVDAIQSERQAS